MKTELLATQVEDIEQIAEKEDLPNFSEPGTGKTLTTVGALEATDIQSGIVVCPTVATLMWQRVLSHELGARVQHLKTRTEEIDKTADFYVLSYGVLEAQAEVLKQVWNPALIIDESHYAKNSSAIRTQTLFGLNGDGLGGLYETSFQCWCLTGTPMERYADDLWSQLRATQPEVLQKYDALELDDFQRQFCRMEWKEYANGKVRKFISTASTNTKLLNRMLYDPANGIGAIRRTMKDVEPFMPETVFRNVFVKAKITPELRSLLVGKSVEEIIELILSGDESVTRARRLLGIAKIQEVANYVEEQAKQHPVVVGYWHTDVGEGLHARLSDRGFKCGFIGGNTSAGHREAVRLGFMAGNLSIVVGQIQAMGVAMDGLQEAAHHVVFAEYDWSWAKMEQFYSRLARKGQKHITQVDFCTSGEAVDEALEEISNQKRADMKEIVG